MKKLLRKRIHPLLGYAFLASAGILSLNTTASFLPDSASDAPPIVYAAFTHPRKSVPPDFPTLKAAAVRFSEGLKAVKEQADAAAKEGRMPPPELYDAIGQGEQLAMMIAQAPDEASLNDADTAGKMVAIAERIKENSAF
jgi:hypothetical protein